MYIEVYGKKECGLCDSAKKKINRLLHKWEMNEEVELVFRDMETVEGAAEGDFYDVFDIPTVLVKDGDDVVARWDDHRFSSQDLRTALAQDRRAA
jgi:thiol-disulfide isomerase/thioredoxin